MPSINPGEASSVLKPSREYRLSFDNDPIFDTFGPGVTDPATRLPTDTNTRLHKHVPILKPNFDLKQFTLNLQEDNPYQLDDNPKD